ncbi:transcription initiation factor IIA subunit 2 isoform X1 [Microtus oregoni]|uniref:transcription initiation factor IIA subunit 2 isoform X1 n=1 Tax=Microtus oregoni TaxID=111838 RepID=UPI001BB25627|nr:transcription initiation factor IIA subunit 2 isoform X1 [Microtus oregoni]
MASPPGRASTSGSPVQRCGFRGRGGGRSRRPARLCWRRGGSAFPQMSNGSATRLSAGPLQSLHLSGPFRLFSTPVCRPVFTFNGLNVSFDSRRRSAPQEGRGRRISEFQTRGSISRMNQ